MEKLPFKLNDKGLRVNKNNTPIICGKNGCTLNHYNFECQYLKDLGYTTEIPTEDKVEVSKLRVNDKKAYFRKK